MAKYTPEQIHNVALVGHGAVGKTSLADLLLHKAGIASKPGSVDAGTSLLDTEEDEKHHKHSIFSSLIHFDHHGRRINLFDTPGYPEFIGQVIGALRSVETAVITISAPAGIEVNTRRVFAEADKADVGKFIVLNKLDHDNVNFIELLASIQDMFGRGCVPFNLPIGLGANFSGVYDTLNPPDSIPDGLPMNPHDVSQMVMDSIVEADEELMERYLNDEKLTKDEINHGVAHAVAEGSLIPVFCMSVEKNVGVDEFLNSIADYADSPIDVHQTAFNSDGENIDLQPDPNGPLLAQIVKTRIDPFVARLSYIRVYSGTLKKESSVHASGVEKPLKLPQLLEVQGAHQEPVNEAGPGYIVAVAKVEDLHMGDTLTDTDKCPRLPKITFPTPMIGLAVEPKSRSDQQKISGALHKIEEEDSTFHVSRDDQTKEMVMTGLSELHLKLIEERLKAREKVEIITHQPKVPYRETVVGAAEGSYRHKKQSGGSGQFAEVHLRVAGLPQGIEPEEYFTKDRFSSMRSYHYDPELNFAFIDRVTGGSVPNNFIPAVEKGVIERMKKGVLAGYQVQDVSCELFFGKDHPVDSNETAFKMAAGYCFRDVFQKAKPNLLEPIVALEVTVPDDKLGDITSDLNSRRGRVEGMEGLSGGYQIIHAKAPLAEVMTYARALSSMTGGQGSFTMDLSHYEPVPPNEQQKIVSAATHATDEDE
ncbi:Elongation factor G [Polystyrenella longa]|uniref:Elongation factor G n=1 Tax=Polystyrenella longa TaxID=2528007 RepID=A0A518CJN2_9PLAN|nr:elongation factor G [Polystyrenella longa]QDU79435.1 Elongation factor G [Polystyrenella longa]